MSKPGLQTDFEYLIARVLLKAFGLLPLRLAVRLGGALAGLVYYLPGKLRRVGETNLKLAFPELSDQQRLALLKGSFQSLGRLFGVFSHFDGKNEKALHELIRCEGLDHLAAAKAKDRGVILFTGHVGAWELCSFGLSLFGQPLSFLVRRIDNPRIEALVDHARGVKGNRTIDKRSAAREMLQILQRRGTLGILVDLNTLDREGIFVDFFGVPASTTFMVAKLARRTGALVLPMFAPWDRVEKRFIVSIGEPLDFDPTGDESGDVRRLTQQFTKAVEDKVRRYPDQWLWIHRRWKTRPEGEEGFYN
jgi:Kdo2-lipid IVA lauroyltransferase/acyltransferase